MVKDTNLAQDLAHDILLKAFLKLSTFKGDAKFSTWLYQVTYTHCIDYIRKQNRRPEDALEEEYLEEEDSGDPGMDEVHEKELLEIKLEQLSVLLNEIKPEEKLFLLMKYQDRFSIQEMAESSGYTESSVKMKLKRARDKVRAMYHQKYGGHE
jgi:RNA polymerase sigma-70 factor (ECF subfamily)